MTDTFVLSQCLVSLAGIAYFWFWLFGSLRRDNFRTKIRLVRDDLFDFMWKNGHSFDTPEYRETRQMLNGILRLSTTLSPVTFFVEAAFAAKRGTLLPMLKTLSEPCKDPLSIKLREARLVASALLVEFVFLQGLVGLFTKGLLNCFSWARTIIKAKRWVKYKAQQFLTLAYMAGDPDLSRSEFSRLFCGSGAAGGG